MPLTHTLAIAAFVLAAIGLAARVVVGHRRQQRARAELLERVGFRPCPEEKDTLQATVARLANDRDHEYRVEQPRRLPGPVPVYHYVKVRDGDGTRETRDAYDELLFRLRRPAPRPVVLFLKPTSLPPGIATRLIGAAAAGPWSTQPDDLERLELPPDLRHTNLLAALGPKGASLYDLVDTRVLGVAQALGDAGGMTLRLRDEWCAVEAGHHQVPFRVDEILARMRPLQ